MPEYHEVTKPKQLLVEGKDALNLFTAMLKNLEIPSIQVQDFGGINELNPFLQAFSKSSGFKKNVTSVGIIRDAETDFSAAFQSVCSALDNSNLPIPQNPIERTATQPQISIFILPDNKSAGMLETVCLNSVINDPAMICVDDYFTCIKQKLGYAPNKIEKARLQTFLASREEPQKYLGIACFKNVWPWDSEPFDNIKRFLSDL